MLINSESTAVNCVALESAHGQCLAWASTYGMWFALQKYALTHFTCRSNFDLEALVRISGSEIALSPVIQILGLQLGSRLYWKAHTKAARKKMEAHIYGLSRTAAST